MMDTDMISDSDVPGSNQSEQRLVSGLRRCNELLDQVADLQEKVKQEKAELKADGFDMPAFNQALKELRGGPEVQEKRLTHEAILDTYRRVAGLPRKMEEAQALITDAVEQLPARRKMRETEGAAAE